MSCSSPLSSVAASDRLVALRELLQQRFPAAEGRDSSVLPTGFSSFDDAEGGLRRGVVTELVGPTSSGALFLEIMLTVLLREQSFGALVQSGGSFNPEDVESSALRRLLWVRCPQPLLAIKAIDLLLRDGNLPLLLLDFQLTPERELQRIPASTWHRFQRLVETTGMAFVILTSHPLIEGAKVRIAIRQRWSLEAMKQRRHLLMERLTAQVFRRPQFSTFRETEQQSA